MNKNKLFSFRGIRFKSNIRLPYGTEITILNKVNAEESNYYITISNSSDDLKKIELESGEVSPKHFIIMNQMKSQKGYISYFAAPSASIDAEAEKISENIINHLLEDRETSCVL